MKLGSISPPSLHPPVTVTVPARPSNGAGLRLVAGAPRGPLSPRDHAVSQHHRKGPQCRGISKWFAGGAELPQRRGCGSERRFARDQPNSPDYQPAIEHK
jgi:hypothetical protein